MSRTIRLSCDGGGMPGAGWSAATELRSLDDGFAIWATDYDGRFRRVKRFSRPLLWREAAYALRASSKYGLQAMDSGDGDELLQHIFVDGVVFWQADMLRLAWMNYEKSADDVLLPLLRLDDEHIHKFCSALGSLVKPPALSKLRQFFGLQQEYGIVGFDLVKHLANEIGLEKTPSLRDFLNTLDSVLEKLDVA